MNKWTVDVSETPIEIKVLRAGDACVLDNVSARVFDGAIDPQASRAFLSDSRHHIAVAIDAGTVVGFASGVHYFHPDKRTPELFVNEVGVTPTHRRRGLAKAILGALFQESREVGCARAWVLTDRDNPGARGLYLSVGSTDGPCDQIMYSFNLISQQAAPPPTAGGELNEASISERPRLKATVRTANLADAEAWLEFRCALWPVGSRSEHRAEVDLYFHHQFPRDPWAVLIAEDRDGRMLGFAELSIRPYAEACRSSRVAYLEGWYVGPKYRGQGVGRLLVSASEDWARSHGCLEFASDADANNDISILAHRAVGFVDVGRVCCFKKEL